MYAILKKSQLSVRFVYNVLKTNPIWNFVGNVELNSNNL